MKYLEQFFKNSFRVFSFFFSFFLFFFLPRFAVCNSLRTFRTLRAVFILFFYFFFYFKLLLAKLYFAAYTHFGQQIPIFPLLRETRKKKLRPNIVHIGYCPQLLFLLFISHVNYTRLIDIFILHYSFLVYYVIFISGHG